MKIIIILSFVLLTACSSKPQYVGPHVLTAAECNAIEDEVEHLFLLRVYSLPGAPNDFNVIEGLVTKYRTGRYTNAYFVIFVEKDVLHLYVYKDENYLKVARRTDVCTAY